MVVKRARMVRTNESLQLERELKRAMERKEFRLYYQPKLDLVTGKIIGVEALIRWDHPEKGLVPPLEFIPLAEETGFIIELGEWVLTTACLQNKAWQEAGYLPLLMSVNLSARQLYQPNFVQRVNQILNETKLAPECLIFEITEGIMLDAFHAPRVIKELKSIGVQISLDDFGTGFNSLQYLHELPIDKIKIDQSFIRNCTSDLNDATIVKSVIELAHQLKMGVVAEGIETKEQLNYLQQNLCNIGQGYLFSKPLPPKELVKNFNQIEQVMIRDGFPPERNYQIRIKESMENNRQEMLNRVKMQQGLFFKFKKMEGKFIHTLCDGKLLYRMGLTPNQVIGKELSDFLPLSFAEDLDRYYRKAWDGEEDVTYEKEINGIYYITSLSPIRRGGFVTEVIGASINITKLKQAEEALKVSESKYRIITENTQDLIRVINLNNRIEYASPSHETVLGYPPEVYQGHLIFEMMHPDDVVRVKNEYADMALSRKPMQTEFRLKYANGGWVDLEIKATPVFHNDKIKQFVIVARDITKRKQAEELIRKSEKLSVVGQLASSIAHEIRNPLTTIKGFVQLLQKEVNLPIYFDTMFSEIKRLEEIIQEFLSLAKPNVCKIKEISLNILLKQVLSLFESQSIMNDIQITKEFDLNLPLIQCDGNQMKQVFIQILQNAVEAMPNGGTIKVQMSGHGTDFVKIRFNDEGSGISKERMRKIGEPFYSTKEKGTGMGLMISYKIVKDHGGWIEMDSSINHGTTVEVILPIKNSNSGIRMDESKNLLLGKKDNTIEKITDARYLVK